MKITELCRNLFSDHRKLLSQLWQAVSHQRRPLHWSMDATCVLEKNTGWEWKSCIFSWSEGVRKI